VVKIKVIILAAGYFQKDLYTNPINNFHLNFPQNKINTMKNQIENKKIEFDDNKEIVSNNPLPNKAHQLILGSLLGDMYCKKENLNSNIEETHSIKQREYLTWKYSVLKNCLKLRLYNQNNPICRIKGKTYTRKPEIRLRSKVSKKLNIYHNLFYRGGRKRISQDILYQLDTLGLAVWYCDDGHYDSGNRTAGIHTEGFSIEENHILKEWFNERWNLKVNFKKDPSKTKVSLRFPVRETDKFLELISSHIFKMPESMWYKLGHFWEGNIDMINKAKLKKSRRMKIYQSKEKVKIRRNQKAKEFYHKNKEKILKEKAIYCKTEKYKEYIKKYNQRPNVIKRRRERVRLYMKNPKYRMKRALYQKEYHKRHEVKLKVKEYNRRGREKRKKGWPK